MRLKKIVSIILAIAMVVTMIPLSDTMNLYAEDSNMILYGDVNADGKIDIRDDLVLKRYIAGENPSEFNFENADVNVDGQADGKDLSMLKKYLAEWDISLGTDVYTVRFYDGDGQGFYESILC